MMPSLILIISVRIYSHSSGKQEMDSQQTTHSLIVTKVPKANHIARRGLVIP